MTELKDLVLQGGVGGFLGYMLVQQNVNVMTSTVGIKDPIVGAAVGAVVLIVLMMAVMPALMED